MCISSSWTSWRRRRRYFRHWRCCVCKSDFITSFPSPHLLLPITITSFCPSPSPPSELLTSSCPSPSPLSQLLTSSCPAPHPLLPITSFPSSPPLPPLHHLLPSLITSSCSSPPPAQHRGLPSHRVDGGVRRLQFCSFIIKEVLC